MTSSSRYFRQPMPSLDSFIPDKERFSFPSQEDISRSAQDAWKSFKSNFLDFGDSLVRMVELTKPWKRQESWEELHDKVDELQLSSEYGRRNPFAFKKKDKEMGDVIKRVEVLQKILLKKKIILINKTLSGDDGDALLTDLLTRLKNADSEAETQAILAEIRKTVYNMYRRAEGRSQAVAFVVTATIFLVSTGLWIRGLRKHIKYLDEKNLKLENKFKEKVNQFDNLVNQMQKDLRFKEEDLGFKEEELDKKKVQGNRDEYVIKFEYIQKAYKKLKKKSDEKINKLEKEILRIKGNLLEESIQKNRKLKQKKEKIEEQQKLIQNIIKDAYTHQFLIYFNLFAKNTSEYTGLTEYIEIKNRNNKESLTVTIIKSGKKFGSFNLKRERIVIYEQNGEEQNIYIERRFEKTKKFFLDQFHQILNEKPVLTFNTTGGHKANHPFQRMYSLVLDINEWVPEERKGSTKIFFSPPPKILEKIKIEIKKTLEFYCPKIDIYILAIKLNSLKANQDFWKNLFDDKSFENFELDLSLYLEKCDGLDSTNIKLFLQTLHKKKWKISALDFNDTLQHPDLQLLELKEFKDMKSLKIKIVNAGAVDKNINEKLLQNLPISLEEIDLRGLNLENILKKNKKNATTRKLNPTQNYAVLLSNKLVLFTYGEDGKQFSKKNLQDYRNNYIQNNPRQIQEIEHFKTDCSSFEEFKILLKINNKSGNPFQSTLQITKKDSNEIYKYLNTTTNLLKTFFKKKLIDFFKEKKQIQFKPNYWYRTYSPFFDFTRNEDFVILNEDFAKDEGKQKSIEKINFEQKITFYNIGDFKEPKKNEEKFEAFLQFIKYFCKDNIQITIDSSFYSIKEVKDIKTILKSTTKIKLKIFIFDTKFSNEFKNNGNFKLNYYKNEHSFFDIIYDIIRNKSKQKGPHYTVKQIKFNNQKYSIVDFFADNPEVFEIEVNWETYSLKCNIFAKKVKIDKAIFNIEVFRKNGQNSEYQKAFAYVTKEENIKKLAKNYKNRS